MCLEERELIRQYRRDIVSKVLARRNLTVDRDDVRLFEARTYVLRAVTTVYIKENAR